MGDPWRSYLPEDLCQERRGSGRGGADVGRLAARAAVGAPHTVGRRRRRASRAVPGARRAERGERGAEHGGEGVEEGEACKERSARCARLGAAARRERAQQA